MTVNGHPAEPHPHPPPASSPGGYRAARALTAAELEAILTAIENADNPAQVLHAAVGGVLDRLLAELGATLAMPPGGQRINPGEYAIPTGQWEAIAAAATNRGAAWGTAPALAMDLVNLMPAAYPDPDAPAPAPRQRADHRPAEHRLDVTRDACDVIAACEAHLHALADFYGQRSRYYLDALTSWHHRLAGLFGMGLGAHTRISRDGDLSLLVHTGSGTFGVIFHGERRSCRTHGCAAAIRDDGAAAPAYTGAPVLGHQHAPSYPRRRPQARAVVLPFLTHALGPTHPSNSSRKGGEFVMALADVTIYLNAGPDNFTRLHPADPIATDTPTCTDRRRCRHTRGRRAGLRHRQPDPGRPRRAALACRGALDQAPATCSRSPRKAPPGRSATRWPASVSTRSGHRPTRSCRSPAPRPPAERKPLPAVTVARALVT